MPLNRITDLQDGSIIFADELDNEFNNIVNALNGTSSDKEIVIRLANNSLSPLTLNQMGAGLLARFQQNGVDKVLIANSGQIQSAVPNGTPPFSIQSSDLVANLNADRLDGIEGVNFVRKDDATLQTIVSNLRLSKTNPIIELADGAVSGILDLNSGNFRIRDNGGDLVTFNSTTHVGTFSQIPLLPAANPTTANQAVRKAYVDSKFTSWGSSWFYAIPPGSTESVESVPRFIVPAGMTAQIAINSIVIVFAGGSHTSGGTLTFTIKRRNAAGVLQSDIGTITINDSGPAINVRGLATPGDTTLAAGDQVYPLLTTRTGTITETLITISVGGYQFLP